MRPADSWKDYELLDATGGNRLERWGETILIRPDPQVVWKTEKQSPLWAKADAIYHRSNQGGGEWEYRRRLPEKWKISCGEGEDKLTLIVSPTGFKHTGVFPEQAVNWAWYARKIRAAGRPVKVLNLFGYTGGATLACAAAGATVCHVDASKGIVAWGKDNAVASGLADRPIRWLVDEVRGPGKAPGQHLRWHHHGPAQLRPRPRRRDLEAGGLHLRAHQPVRGSAERYAPLLCGQQLHHRPVPRGHGVYAQDHAGAPLWRQDQL